MKKVLLLMICVFATIGAWAMMPPGQPELFGTCGTEKVLKIDVHQTGQLKTALDQAQQEGMDFQYLHIKTGPGEATITLNAEDIAALNSLNVTTIDLQTAKLSDFTLNNSTVSYIMLPLGWTKEQVKVVGETHKGYANFKACLSTSNTKDRGDATLIAYLNVAGSMTDVIRHTYFTNKDNHIEDTKTLGNGQGDCSRLRTLVVMGNFCAKDISRRGVYDENGHYVINGVADENSRIQNTNTEGGQLYAGANDQAATDGALKGCYGVEVIDLKDAYVPNEYCEDIVLAYTGFTTWTSFREVWMPEDPRFNIVPADYLSLPNGSSSLLRQLCIPGNITTIRTRAFNCSGTRIDYVWTTGPDANTMYDNGAYFVSGETTTQKYIDNPDPENQPNATFADGDYNNFTYGTITLPANLELIERFAFGESYHVSDVYVLNETAPECHVDAFSSVMYHANNTVTNDKIKEVDGVKIITRDAYTMDDYMMMTVLHYPRTTTTPNTQRYTDPSREYSIATGERDGNGNTIYFPTQTEFEVAHHEGTHGYLWNGWNISRTWYNQEITLGGESGWYGNSNTTGGHDATGAQAAANQFYYENPNKDKKDNSFYDVTMGDHNTPGEEPYPSGLKPYYTITRPSYSGPLYPQAETEIVYEDDGVTPKTVEQQKRDADGNLKYVLNNTNGTYIQLSSQEYQLSETGSPLYVKESSFVVCPQPPDGYYAEAQRGNLYVYDTVNDKYIKITTSSSQEEWNIGYQSGTFYNRVEAYREAVSPDDDNLPHYALVTLYSYRLATPSDPEGDRWSPDMETVNVTKVTKANDYRGWHQFVLAAVAHNSKIPFEPIRSFISDNDWWTICEPFDLRYNDMIKFFGYDRAGFDKKIPYLSKLMYVVRDVENKKITLMFSKNLMEYKEQFLDDNTQIGKSTSNRVHGVVDDETMWTPEELAANPIILHAGVPYLIKPNMVMEEGKFTRQFDIYKRDNEDLYNRLQAAQAMSGATQMQLVYSGEYTVPAYVVGLGADGAVSESVYNEGQRTISNSDGSQFTYQNSTKSGKKLTYRGKQVDYEVSSKYTYTFVGTYYKSLMPQYCYFLGWDSSRNRAAFWYSAVQDQTGWNWNNETGIICPNFNTSLKIHQATTMNDPARWVMTSGTDLESDDFPEGGTSPAKSYVMDFGATNFFDVDVVVGGITTDINKTETDTTDNKVYSADGIYLGSSLRGLAKGLYIVNGKKYVVK